MGSINIRSVRAIGVLALGIVFAATASAQAERLDDSSSPRSRVQAQVETGGQPPVYGRPQNPQLTVRFGRIEYRLATARYAGRRARIFYVVPASIPGLVSPAGLRVEWRGNGLFASGAARPGERTLVWTGTVRDAFINESFDLSLQIDLRQVRLQSGADLGFESYFEIEAMP